MVDPAWDPSRDTNPLWDDDVETVEDEARRKAEAPIFEALAEAYGAPWFGLALDWAADADREEQDRWEAGPF